MSNKDSPSWDGNELKLSIIDRFRENLRPMITWTDKGLFCELGGFYIDPHRAVDVAIVTHAHSDHARKGAKHYICAKSGIGLLKARLGQSIKVTGFEYQEKFRLGEVLVSFHSAGHILGSAQVRLEHRGQVWVASGDYKRDHDPSCDAFEIVACDTFITEATFGTPKFVWKKNQKHGEDIFNWWQNIGEKNCLLFGYSLGKAQRILAELEPFAQRPVLIHDTICALTECYREEGRKLAATSTLKERLKDPAPLSGELILAPPSVLTEAWAHRLGRYETAFASGWMQSGGWGRGRYDRGFVMSDHADWNDLNLTIEQTGASTVYVQHRDGALVRHLKHKGIDAFSIEALRPREYEAEENLVLL